MVKKTSGILRKKYPQFIYESFSWRIEGKSLRIFFDFRIPPDVSFSPSLTIENIDLSRLRKLEKKGIVDRFVFNLGLVELISYWKTTCSPEILVKAGPLNADQAGWWKDLIINGLGQFFYENKINFRPRYFVKIISAADGKFTKTVKINLRNRFLVPLGGGKDSIVTLEMLREGKKEFNCFSLNTKEAVKKILEIAGCRKPIIVHRQIDRRLLELNRQGFLNGHTPFSAYLAFSSSFCAVLFDYRFLALSNERSANEGNVKYLGKEVNHQYSKSFEFEKKFRQYSAKYLASGVEYFSFLRPLYELQIAKVFSNYPQYFKSFLSCNEAQKTHSGKIKPTQRWCGRCPKCLFVFICLRPFLGEEKVSEIFGKNLLKDKTLLPLKQQLLGKKGIKPFECVGTAKETRSALTGKGMEKILRSWDNSHYLPPALVRLLKKNF